MKKKKSVQSLNKKEINIKVIPFNDLLIIVYCIFIIGIIIGVLIRKE